MTTHKDIKTSSRKTCTCATRPGFLWEALESRAYCRADVTKVFAELPILSRDTVGLDSSRPRWRVRSFFKPSIAVRAYLFCWTESSPTATLFSVQLLGLSHPLVI